MKLFFKLKPKKQLEPIQNVIFELENGENINVEIRPNRGSNRIRMRLSRDGNGVLVTAPPRTNIAIIKAFVLSHKEWLLKQRQSKTSNIIFEPNIIIPILGRPTILEIAKPRTKVQFIKNDNYYAFDGSKISDNPEPVARLLIPSNEINFAEKAKTIIRKIALAKAQEFVAEFTPKLNRLPAKIAVRDTKSRWGSCNTRGDLSLSWRLVFAPEMVFKEVVAHELAHLKEMNHSKAFYAELSRIMPEHRQYKDWLKQHGRTLHMIG